MSKRKATYGRADRGNYHTRKRKKAARMAIESRWKGIHDQSVALGDVTNTTPQLGSRIMDLDNLGSDLKEISSHSVHCGGMCVLEGEIMQAGLAAVLSVKCIKCESTFCIHSSKRVKTSDGHQRWVVNVAAVLGQMSTGGGATSLTCTLAPMNVPGMAKRLYTVTEQFSSDTMKQLLTDRKATAGEEERKLAIERGDYHQGIPAIKVVVDGGWSKRSHKHSYNAKSGVAVIFGQRTKKLLFIGVRNKYCAVCSVSEKKQQEPPQHRCYRNWSGSSAAMESDILVEGFRMSEQTHGIQYLHVIGDGDSSLMANLQQSVAYGPFTEKIECVNHVCKGYRSRLEKLAKNHPKFEAEEV